MPGGPIAKNLLARGNMGSVPSLSSKIPPAMGQLSPRTATTEPMCPTARVLKQEMLPK